MLSRLWGVMDMRDGVAGQSCRIYRIIRIQARFGKKTLPNKIEQKNNIEVGLGDLEVLYFFSL